MKKILSTLVILIFSNIVIAQTTAILDTKFEQALIDLGYEIEMKTEGSQIILKDPNWIKITEKAKEIIELIKTH
jgi:hypothetical protein